MVSAVSGTMSELHFTAGEPLLHAIDAYLRWRQLAYSPQAQRFVDRTGAFTRKAVLDELYVNLRIGGKRVHLPLLQAAFRLWCRQQQAPKLPAPPPGEPSTLDRKLQEFLDLNLVHVPGARLPFIKISGAFNEFRGLPRESRKWGGATRKVLEPYFAQRGLQFVKTAGDRFLLDHELREPLVTHK